MTLTPVELARKAGPYGSREYHNAYQKARYAILRKDPVYLQSERAYNKRRYAKPELRALILERQRIDRLSVKGRARQVAWHLRRHYKMTVEEYDEKFLAQNGRCAICEIAQSELPRRMEVDHSHVSGKVRGLLCRKCNLVLGIVSDSELTLASAIAYLRRWS